MRKLADARVELIDALVAEADLGGVTASLLEKDDHLTAALHAVFGLEFEHAKLVFCGGTSLSKARGLIERMSEDADIKVVMSQETSTWSANKLRRYLGDEVRNRVKQTLEAIGLVEDVHLRRSLNGNRYLHSQWSYERVYNGIAALRPNLQIELTARSPIQSIEHALVGSLADRFAGRIGPSLEVPVVAISETLAEKVLSFLRRFALHQNNQAQYDWDSALVRHVYDVHCIYTLTPEVLGNAEVVFASLTAGDKEEFGYQDAQFAKNPSAVLTNALQLAKDDPQLQSAYEGVLIPLVYRKDKFTYEDAWTSFESVARQLLRTL
jgi:predicted nucleotidyltransferase component of viral defense system